MKQKKGIPSMSEMADLAEDALAGIEPSRQLRGPQPDPSRHFGTRPEEIRGTSAGSDEDYRVRFGIAVGKPKLPPLPESPPWRMVQGTSGHTGFQHRAVADWPLLLKWRFPTGRNLVSPSLVASENVYAVSHVGIVYCLDFRSGQLRWQRKLDSRVAGAPALAGDSLFCPGLDGNIYILNQENGQVTAKRKTRPPSGLAAKTLGLTRPEIAADLVAEGDSVYFAACDGYVYELSASDHTVRKSAPVPGPVLRGGLAVNGDRVYVACATGEVAALVWSVEPPRIIWKVRTAPSGRDSFQFPLTLTPGAVLLTSLTNDYLLARSVLDGHILWAASLPGGAAASPSVNATSAFITCNGKNGFCHVIALDLATGKKLWKTKILADGIGPSVISQESVIFGSDSVSKSLVALDARTGAVLWQASDFSAVTTPPVPYAGHLLVTTRSGYIAAYEPCENLEDNRLVPKPLPNPFMDWEGTVSDFHWRLEKWPRGSAKISYRMQDFSFKFLPEDDATPWLVLSKPMVPFEPFFFGPTYTGLMFPMNPDETVRVIGVRGIDRPHENYYDLHIPDKERVLTALIIARKLRGTWKPIYVSNWFTSWAPNSPGVLEPAIAGYFFGKKRPFDIYLRLSRETLPLLSTFDRGFVSQASYLALAHGYLVPDSLLTRRLKLVHYWGKRNRSATTKLYYGFPGQLMLLKLFRR